MQMWCKKTGFTDRRRLADCGADACMPSSRSKTQHGLVHCVMVMKGNASLPCGVFRASATSISCLIRSRANHVQCSSLFLAVSSLDRCLTGFDRRELPIATSAASGAHSSAHPQPAAPHPCRVYVRPCDAPMAGHVALVTEPSGVASIQATCHSECVHTVMTPPTGRPPPPLQPPKAPHSSPRCGAALRYVRARAVRRGPRRRRRRRAAWRRRRPSRSAVREARWACRRRPHLGKQ